MAGQAVNKVWSPGNLQLIWRVPQSTFVKGSFSQGARRMVERQATDDDNASQRPERVRSTQDQSSSAFTGTDLASSNKENAGSS